MTAHPDPIDVHAGRRIRVMRKAAGLTQEQLATHLGLTFQQVQKYERGANRVSVSTLYRIAVRLGVEPGFVFDSLPSRPSAPPSSLDAFALAPGGVALAETFVGLSRSRQAAVLAVARALSEEQGPR